MQASLHIHLDFYECRADPSTLTSPDMELKILELIREAGFTVRKSLFDNFEGGGFTYFISIAESHVIVGTWPEDGWVEIDIVSCNYTRDNSEKAYQLERLFQNLFIPERIERDERTRGPARNF